MRGETLEDKRGGGGAIVARVTFVTQNIFAIGEVPRLNPFLCYGMRDMTTSKAVKRI